MSEILVLSFGSNLGDRKYYLGAALKLMQQVLGEEPLELSPIIETKAVGFSGPDFLDMAAVFKTNISPLDVLSFCKDVERSLGRDEKLEYGPDGKRIYHDRTIDIDILFYGNLTLETAELTLPHPQVFQREYVSEMLQSLELARPLLLSFKGKICNFAGF